MEQLERLERLKQLKLVVAVTAPARLSSQTFVAMSDLNDPRVFFAAERTLMAWTRTAVALMAFGFAIERFGLFLHTFLISQGEREPRMGSFWIGVSFILFGAIISVLSVIQYKGVLKTLKPIEIPEGYWVNMALYTNLLVAALGLAMIGYFVFSLG